MTKSVTTKKKKKLVLQPPTPKDQKAFADLFTKDQWNECCADFDFMEQVQNNLAKAQIRAVEILNGEN